MPSVLFVCTANRFRSPLAAAWFQRCLERQPDSLNWTVGSAGTWADPGLPVVPSAKWMADHFGINLDSHKAIRINRELLAHYDLILAMENSQQEALQVEFPEMINKIILVSNVAVGVNYDIPDPGIVTDDTFLDIANELTGLIDKGFENICRLAVQLKDHG